MFWTIFRIELAFLRRQATTYLFFAVLFLLAFFSIASDAFQIDSASGNVFKNSPSSLATIMTVMTAIGQVITTALVGTAILRDVQVKAHELLFTTRVTRVGYLGGRFAGAALVMIGIYAALPLGSFVGTLMPWVDYDRLQAFHVASYARPFVFIVGSRSEQRRSDLSAHWLRPDGRFARVARGGCDSCAGKSRQIALETPAAEPHYLAMRQQVAMFHGVSFPASGAGAGRSEE